LLTRLSAAAIPIADARPYAAVASAEAELLRFARERFHLVAPAQPNEIVEARTIVARLRANLEATGASVRDVVEEEVRTDYARGRWRRAGDMHVPATDRALQILAVSVPDEGPA